MYPSGQWPGLVSPGHATVVAQPPPQRFCQHQNDFPGTEPFGYGHQYHHRDNPILLQQLHGYQDHQHYRNGMPPPPPGSSMQMHHHHYPPLPPPPVPPYPSPSQSDFIPMGPPPPRASPVHLDRFTPTTFQNNREAIFISTPSPGPQPNNMQSSNNNYFPQQSSDQQTYLQTAFNRHAPSPVLYAALKNVNLPQRSPLPPASAAASTFPSPTSSNQQRGPSVADGSVQIVEERIGIRDLDQRQSSVSPAKPKANKDQQQNSHVTETATSSSRTERNKPEAAAGRVVTSAGQKQQVVCPVEDCRKVMATRKTLERHFQIHVKTKDVPCPVCKKMFQTPQQRGEHVFKMHPKHYPAYKATRDQDEYEIKIKQMCCQVLKMHELEQKSKPKKDVVPIADEDEESRQSSASSSAKNVSGSEASSTETDNGPVRRRATGPLKCQICGKDYSGWKAYKRHWKTVHVKLRPAGGGVSCDFCQQTFKDLTTAEGYNEHCQAHFKAYTKTGKIWLQDNDMEDNSQLRIVHVASIASEPTSEEPLSYGQATTDTTGLEKDRPFGCDLQGCFARFKRRQHLEAHNIKHHGTGGSFGCPVQLCSRRFVYKHDLKNHVRGKHKEMYDQTSEDGIRRSDLQKEQQQQADQSTSEAPVPLVDNYQCIICHSTFIKLTGLQSHIRKVHPEEYETEFQHISKDQLKQIFKPSVTKTNSEQEVARSKRKSSTPKKCDGGLTPTSPGLPMFSSTRRSESIASWASLEPNFNGNHDLNQDPVVPTRSPTSACKRQKLADERVTTAVDQKEQPEDVYHSVNIHVLPHNQDLPSASGKYQQTRDQNAIVIQELPMPSQRYTAETKAQFIRGCRFPIIKVETDVEIIDELHTEQQQNYLEVLLCPDPKCSRSFSSKAKLKVHLKHKKSQRSKCLKCKSTWFHPYGKKSPHCPSCKKKRNEKKNLEAAERYKPSSWVKTIAITCCECAQQFKTEEALRNHLLETHMDPVTERECPTCSFMLGDSIEFWVHTRAHAFDRARPVDCTQKGCEQRFSDDQDLQMHLKLHHGIPKEHLNHQPSAPSSNNSSSTTTNSAVRKNLSDLCLADLLASTPCAPKVKPAVNVTPTKSSPPTPARSQPGSTRKGNLSSSEIEKRSSNSPSNSRTACSKPTSSRRSSSALGLSPPSRSISLENSKHAEEVSIEDTLNEGASDCEDPKSPNPYSNTEVVCLPNRNVIYNDNCDNVEKVSAQKPVPKGLNITSQGFEKNSKVNSQKEKVTLKSSSLKPSDNENV